MNNIEAAIKACYNQNLPEIVIKKIKAGALKGIEIVNGEILGLGLGFDYSHMRESQMAGKYYELKQANHVLPSDKEYYELVMIDFLCQTQFDPSEFEEMIRMEAKADRYERFHNED